MHAVRRPRPLPVRAAGRRWRTDALPSPPRSTRPDRGRDMASQVEHEAMRQALALAAEADLRLDANPSVGAVVLDQRGTVVGAGAHRGAGTPHAEVVALEA